MTVQSKNNFGNGDVIVSTVTQGVNRITPFTSTTIPLALASDSSTPTAYLPTDAQLPVFKENGFLWTIKFKSTIGDVAGLGSKTDTLTGGSLAVQDNFVGGSASNSYAIQSLMPGINYYVRVAASTDVGIGAFTSTASAIPSGIATPVRNVAAGYALNVREVQEVRIGATHITEIQEVSTTAARMAEVQTIRTFASANACFDGNCIKGRIAFRVPTVQTIKITAQGPITAGSFSINFVRYVADATPGQSKPFGTVFDTVKINWDATPDVVTTAMAALDAVDASDIVVTRDGDASSAFGFGYVFSITFVGTVVAGETEAIVVKDKTSGCATCDPFVTDGNVPYSITVDRNVDQAMGTDTAVQEVIVKANKPLVAGSYRLVMTHLGGPVSSSCINFDAPARGTDVRAMENILQSMTNIDRVYVTRSLDPVNAPNGFRYLIFFFGNLVYGAVNDLTWTPCDAFQTQENNALTTNGVGGTVAIRTVDPGGFSQTNTFVDAATATAAQLEADLDRLPVFGDVIVTRSLADQQGGFSWTVAFRDSQGNLPQFICAVDNTFATTAGTSCETTTLTDGNALSGSFVIESSVPIAFDASAAAVKSAMEAMAWVGIVQVSRVGPSPQMGFTWSITFLDYYGDVPPLLVTSSLVGTGSAITVREVRKGNQVGGTFTLSYLSSATKPIAWNAPATRVDSKGDGTSMQELLEALDVVGPLSVTRSARDQDGGFTWLITFLDDKLNPGNVPLLTSNTTLLTGVGTVLFVREVVKGSNAVGDQLWLSWDPPTSDNGSPITKYGIRWDTSAAFTANPNEVAITDPEQLYRIQEVSTGAPSLAWSQLRTPFVDEVQQVTILAAAANGATFTLSFRGVTSAALIVGTSTSVDLATALQAMSSVGAVVVSPATGTLSPTFRLPDYVHGPAW
ncbi:hypothetical protein PINS_up005110 [Pythium insidiosum]|nr:hypothetical protein PINS_up005110 [Pythium insidiosum]